MIKSRIFTPLPTMIKMITNIHIFYSNIYFIFTCARGIFKSFPVFLYINIHFQGGFYKFFRNEVYNLLSSSRKYYGLCYIEFISLVINFFSTPYNHSYFDFTSGEDLTLLNLFRIKSFVEVQFLK